MRIVPVAIAASAIMLVAAGAGLNAASTSKLNRAQVARVMHARHEGMETIGKSFKALHRELDASSPNLATVRAASATVAKLALQSNAWFPAGTGPEVGKTGAKPEIWQNSLDVAAKLRRRLSEQLLQHVHRHQTGAAAHDQHPVRVDHRFMGALQAPQLADQQHAQPNGPIRLLAGLRQCDEVVIVNLNLT